MPSIRADDPEVAQGDDPSATAAARVRQVADRLTQVYDAPAWRRHRPPLDELILTVLSQHTSDVNSIRAFASLTTRFPTWDEVRTAPTNEVEVAIRSGGLASLKAARIQRILHAVAEDGGAAGLERLVDVGTAEARRRLVRLPGVGPKTASCVLLFSLGLPALPVDTHVHRVAARLGLIGPSIGADRAHEALETGLGGDRDRVYAFHLNMIAHGRRVCAARRPFCDRCRLTDCCDYFAATRQRRA